MQLWRLVRCTGVKQDSSFTILDASDAHDIIKRLLADKGIEGDRKLLERVQQCIGLAKNALGGRLVEAQAAGGDGATAQHGITAIRPTAGELGAVLTGPLKMEAGAMDTKAVRAVWEGYRQGARTCDCRCTCTEMRRALVMMSHQAKRQRMVALDRLSVGAMHHALCIAHCALRVC